MEFIIVTATLIMLCLPGYVGRRMAEEGEVGRNRVDDFFEGFVLGVEFGSAPEDCVDRLEFLKKKGSPEGSFLFGFLGGKRYEELGYLGDFCGFENERVFYFEGPDLSNSRFYRYGEWSPCVDLEVFLIWAFEVWGKPARQVKEANLRVLKWQGRRVSVTVVAMCRNGKAEDSFVVLTIQRVGGSW